jgi:hypothetical protein
VKKKSALTLDSLRATVDPRVVAASKITAHLAALKKAGVEYQTEGQLLSELQIAPVHMRLVKKQFEKHTAEVRQLQNGKKGTKAPLQVWFPNPADAATIRKEQKQIKDAMQSTEA